MSGGSWVDNLNAGAAARARGEVTAETLTDEEIESEMVHAGKAGNWDCLELCRIAAEGCATPSKFTRAQQAICAAINDRQDEEVSHGTIQSTASQCRARRSRADA